MGKKKTFKPQPFESTGISPITGREGADTSANIFESMMMHPAFKALKPRQKYLYVMCKAQYFGHRKPMADYKDQEFNIEGVRQKLDDRAFYMSWSQVQEYGMYKNGKKEFYEDMKELARLGFIEVLSNGHANHQKSIYLFSRRWRTIKPEPYG